MLWKAAILALIAPAGLPAADPTPNTLCANQTGTHDGYFYTFWHDRGETCVTLGPAGSFSTQWDLRDGGNLVVGKGWQTGSPSRTIGYNAASFVPGSNGYLTLYGWSTDPLIEYYVVDNHGTFAPPGHDAAILGTVESDGGTYRIYRTQRVEKPSIRGTATFYQYWSVRTERRALATDHVITFANHVAAWRRHGMELGRMNYQVMAAEGFGSMGRASIRVWEK